jgi:hypothetical protein
MSTREDLTREISAAVAGVSHDANFKDDDGADTLDQTKATYQYLPKFGIMVMTNHDSNPPDVEVWFDPDKTDKEWLQSKFKPMIEAIARKYLYGTTVRSYAGEITPKQLSHRTEVTESRNSLKISYHPLGDTKIRVAHSKSVTEEKPGARSRNIKALFIEKDGERLRFPYNHLLGARVMALHVESGGKPWDATGEKILEISRRRKDIMELLRGTKKYGGKEQVDEIRERGRNEVIMLRRVLERAARTGNLGEVAEFQLPSREEIANQSMVSEAIAELDNALIKLLG